MRVNDAMIEALKAEGVEFIFGLWGGFVYGKQTDDPDIKGIQLRHEGSAPFAAMAYSRLSEKTGVCAASGSGGTGLSNMVSGVLEAYAACTPMIIHTHAPSTEVNGMGAFAECDNVGLMKPITKWSVHVPRPERMPWFMHRAFSIAHNGRPGPVFFEVPLDIMNADVEMPKYKPITLLRTRGDPDRIREAVNLLVKAERPIVVAGGGTILSRAFESFYEFVELLGIPFLTTPQGRSILPEDHPLSLGLCGIYTSKVAKKIYDEADLIMTIGSRMEAFQSVTFRYFPEKAKFIQIDIEPQSIGLNWVPNVAILGDAKLVLRDLINGIKERIRKRNWEEMPRISEIIKAKKDYEAEVEEELKAGAIPISPKFLAKELNTVFGKNTILCNENGNNDIWTYIYPYYKVLDQWSTVPMGEETCFGLGIVGTIGAKLARPDMKVLCPTGDGAFQHYNKEIATAAQYRLGVTWAIFNNFGLGVPEQFKVQPDFVKLAEASKCYGERVERPSELKQALKNSLKANKEDIPAVVDIIIQHEPSWGSWGAWGQKFPSLHRRR
jgi:acetolactate synthase-1/2/3 large subunit